MKHQILFAVAVALITPMVAIIKGSDSPPVHQTATAVAQAPESEPTVNVPHEAEKPPQRAETLPQPAPARPATCRAAIEQVIPAHLRAGFITVLVNENGSENPAAEGAINKDTLGRFIRSLSSRGFVGTHGAVLVLFNNNDPCKTRIITEKFENRS